jgi:hypothetical protein
MSVGDSHAYLLLYICLITNTTRNANPAMKGKIMKGKSTKKSVKAVAAAAGVAAVLLLPGCSTAAGGTGGTLGGTLGGTVGGVTGGLGGILGGIL